MVTVIARFVSKCFRHTAMRYGMKVSIDDHTTSKIRNKIRKNTQLPLYAAFVKNNKDASPNEYIKNLPIRQLYDKYLHGLAVGETAAILSAAKVECGGGSFPRC